MFKFFDAFKQGNELSNADGWKNVQNATTALAVVLNVLLYVAKLFFELPEIPEEKVLAVSGGVAAIVNVALTYTTTRKPLMGQKEPSSPTLSQDNTGG